MKLTKKDKTTISVIFILIILNYILYPYIFPSSRTDLAAGGELAQISSNQLLDSSEFDDIEIFGYGYAILQSVKWEPGRWLTSYNFDHELLWEVDLSQYNDPGTYMVGSGIYLSLLDHSGNYLISYENDPDNLGNITQHIQFRDPKALIFDLNGDLLSSFSLKLSNITQSDITGNLSKYTYIRAGLIQWDTLFMVEFDYISYLNSSQTTQLYLHSYNLQTGNMNWREKIFEIHSTMENSIATVVVDIKVSWDNELEILLKSYSDNFALHRITLQLTELLDISGIIEETNTYSCYDRCSDVLVLSFDEVVSISSEVVEWDRIYTYTSSRGYNLDISPAVLGYPTQTIEYTPSMWNSRTCGINTKTIALSGKIRASPSILVNYLGILSSNDKLKLHLIDMNDTRIKYIQNIGVDRLLTVNEGNDIEVVLWSLLRLNLLDWFNPVEKNILPLILLIPIVIYYASKKDKNKKNALKDIDELFAEQENE